MGKFSYGGRRFDPGLKWYYWHTPTHVLPTVIYSLDYISVVLPWAHVTVDNGYTGLCFTYLFI